MQELTQLILDSYHGTGEAQKYSKAQNVRTIREALIDLNNGKTSIDYRDIRDGKCSGLFTLIEEVIEEVVESGMQGNEFFTTFVEEKNIGKGDENLFVVKKNQYFKIAEIAPGTQGLRRQRLNPGETFTVPMAYRGVRIFEEMDRVLSGRTDMSDMINTVSRSIEKDKLDRIYTLWSGLTQTTLGSTYYPTAGTYSEEALVDLIAHVEAATGGSAMLIGSIQALRKLGTALVPDSAREDMYNFGYVGRFNGTPTIKVDQRHQVGTDTFIFPTNKIYVVGTEDRPIKYVTRGDMIIKESSFLDNADLTQEYLCIYEDGISWVSASKMGIYEISQ